MAPQGREEAWNPIRSRQEARGRAGTLKQRLETGYDFKEKTGNVSDQMEKSQQRSGN